METELMTPRGYTLMPVNIGSNLMYARPIEWNDEDADGFGNDIDGEPIYAIKWHSTCPECAQLIEFDSDMVYVGMDKFYVVCKECQVGADEADGKSLLSSRETNEEESEKLVFEEEEEDLYDSWLPMSKTTTNMFVDPISSGKMLINVDLEMLDLLK